MRAAAPGATNTREKDSDALAFALAATKHRGTANRVHCKTVVFLAADARRDELESVVREVQREAATSKAEESSEGEAEADAGGVGGAGSLRRRCSSFQLTLHYGCLIAVLVHGRTAK